MNRKFFWFGYVLAVGALLWILGRKRRDEMEEIVQRVQHSAPNPREWFEEAIGREAVTSPSQSRPTKAAAPKRPQESDVDDLQQISGIGPAYERRLYDAGITRYRQLAELSADEVRERIQLETWRGDVEDWIAQARDLAG